MSVAQMGSIINGIQTRLVPGGQITRRFGGRWNREGSTVLYAASSPSLAMLEKLVHLNLTTLPSDMRLTAIEVPDKASMTKVLEKDLPKQY